MPTPLNDLVAFLTGAAADYEALGAARYVVLVVFYALVVASLTLLVVNLRDDRGQRSGGLLWLWLVRVAVGCLWFKAMLWTLPFGTDNGLHAWTAAVPDRAALPQVARFATDALLPHFGVFDPLAFLAAFGVAAALILGLLVRVAALVGFAMAAALWLGLYGAPAGETAASSAASPWGFALMALLCGTLAVLAAGRALGADAWIRRAVPSVRDRRPAGLLLRGLT
ncbi:DoxX family protein [Lichenibacterium ramalinae]|uniref:DoxX family protein n=1 Tax=Lichenibacterium ramalinae TaxID=2316527 RepID=A0A4V1RIN6_9HYPH|nr:DoxX family protein [Lichenibacterium ramalinae]RYB04762.1 DoxX family protein [Lichenibacterium ramalinae]